MKTKLTILFLFLFLSLSVKSQRENIINNYIGMNKQSIMYLMVEVRKNCFFVDAPIFGSECLSFENCTRNKNDLYLGYFFLFNTHKENTECYAYYIRCSAIDRDALISKLSKNGKLTPVNKEAWILNDRGEQFYVVGRYIANVYHLYISMGPISE